MNSLYNEWASTSIDPSDMTHVSWGAVVAVWEEVDVVNEVSCFDAGITITKKSQPKEITLARIECPLRRVHQEKKKGKNKIPTPSQKLIYLGFIVTPP